MDKSDELQRQHVLIYALGKQLESTHGDVSLFETHISWVLVAGEFAYKFKKALRFDFLDFLTLQARRFYCEEEVRLNSRLAPEIYLGVLAIGGTIENPLPGGGSDAIEYCVQMRAFPQQALWSYRLPHRLLTGSEIDDLAIAIARFHLKAARAPDETRWGTPSAVQEIAHDNYAQIAAAVHGQARQWISEVQAWGMQQQARLEPVIVARKRRGYVREGHGDLHSGNILTLAGKAQAFDCIEFNDNLRWIDVINDLAFIYMDLRFQGRRDLAARCLNRYLEASGDYDGVRLLRYYQVQRALVRCKVALLQMQQAGSAQSGAERHEQAGLRYLEYALKNIATAPAPVMITHGFSGSGKSVFARLVVECCGAIQLRSDVERKRLHDPIFSGAPAGAIGAGLYSEHATERTYERLLVLARTLVQEGMPVIVDAAFLKQTQRRVFTALAVELDVPFVIFDLQASEATMRTRVVQRKALAQDPSDADIDVLNHQLRNHEPLSDEELSCTIVVDAEAGVNSAAVQTLCERVGLSQIR